jgi:hypothetical protein
MLLPQSAKSKQRDLPPPLETPEECFRAEERDEALTRRAKRREAEALADRARFELTRDKIVFGIELIVSLTVLVATAGVLALNPELVPMALLGGGIGGVAVFRTRKTVED